MKIVYFSSHHHHLHYNDEHNKVFCADCRKALCTNKRHKGKEGTGAHKAGRLSRKKKKKKKAGKEREVLGRIARTTRSAEVAAGERQKATGQFYSSSSAYTSSLPPMTEEIVEKTCLAIRNGEELHIGSRSDVGVDRFRIRGDEAEISEKRRLSGKGGMKRETELSEQLRTLLEIC